MSKYDDIIHLPHHVSEKRVQMPISDRAAQFSPFAALTGYDGIIAETGRLTEKAVELDESALEELNAQLRLLQERIHTRPAVIVTYFRPDPRKSGGSYLTKTAPLKKLDTTAQYLLFTDGTQIGFDQLLTIELAE